MKHFTKEHFKTMPWKNGGGTTLELICIPGFRLSVADVLQNGPFSIFSGMVRHLLILEGAGCELQFNEIKQVLLRGSSAIEFSGKDAIECSLIQGPVKDFNVMINPEWGKAIVERNKLPDPPSWDMLFIYNILENELFEYASNENIQITAKNYICVKVILSNNKRMAL